MAVSSTSRGILPVDIVLRSVIQLGLRDMRLHPDLLDDCLSTLTDDDETEIFYGANEAARAKEWFLRTDLPVKIVEGYDPPSATSITIGIHEGQETDATLADGHYETTVVDDTTWQVLAGPLTPTSYDPTAGVIVFPDAFTLFLVPGMLVVDREGGEHPILTAGTRTATIARGAFDLTDMTVRGMRPDSKKQLQSVVERETYRIGAWTHGEPIFMSWLFWILKYVMYRARFDLERRGMERVQYSTTGPASVSDVGAVENVFSRFIVVSASVRQVWASRAMGRLYNVDLDLKLSAQGQTVDYEADVLTVV